jgi:hypothetical protein
MSKRLNKRQQREQDELAELEFAKAKLSVAADVRNVDVDHNDDEDEHEQGEEQSKPSNLFAAVSTAEAQRDIRYSDMQTIALLFS